MVEFTRAFDDYDDDDDDDGGGGDDEGNDDGDDRLTTCATLSQVAASLAPSDDEDVHAGSDDECPINVSVLAQKISDEKATVQEEERRVAIRKSNLLLWEDQMREHTATATRRKRAREEEIEGMLDETLVDRQVIASYIKDVGEYADPNGSLTEHFKSSKREERVFSHSRGLQHLRGEGFGLGVSRFVRAQVSHSYLGVSSEHKVVVVCEVRDVPSYFNVGVTQTAAQARGHVARWIWWVRKSLPRGIYTVPTGKRHARAHGARALGLLAPDDRRGKEGVLRAIEVRFGRDSGVIRRAANCSPHIKKV